MDPELQPIGWAMEEEMEDPGEEVLSGGGGCIYFLVIFSWSFWQVMCFFSRDLRLKTLKRHLGIGKEFIVTSGYIGQFLRCFFFGGPRNKVTTDESGHQPRRAGQLQ